MNGAAERGERHGDDGTTRACDRTAPWPAAVGAIVLLVGGAIAWWAWPAGVPRRYLFAIFAASMVVVAFAALGRAGVARLWAGTLGRLPFWIRVTLVSGVIIAVSLRLARWPDVRGVPFLIHVGTACIALAAWCGAVVAALRRAPPRRAALTTASAAVAMGIIVLAAIAVEACLAVLASGAAGAANPPRAPTSRFDVLRADDPLDLETWERALARHDHAVMPDAWRARPFDHPGARLAQWWHGVRHVEDHDGVRLSNDESPEAAPVAATVLVIGDSFTYGFGIETRDRFTERLESLLRDSGVAARVVNRGVCSDQSEDVLRRLPHNLDEFAPDVIVYAICLNDFLPSGVDIYDRSWRLPDGLAARSRLLQMIDGALVQGQIALGLSADFHSDILRNLGDCRDRFERDVNEMARLARERDTPILALVLDSIPSRDGSGAAIAAAAEDACRRAGIDVVDTALLHERFEGVPLTVSPWESHANEIAHAAWARLLFVRIHPMLESRSTLRPAAARPAAQP